MSSFDEFYKNSDLVNTYDSEVVLMEFYEAGAQSRQAEIDCLKVQLDSANERAMMTLKHKNKMVEKRDREIYWLKRRIDAVETLISTWNSEHDELQRCRDSNANCLSICIDQLSEALKGNQS